MRRRPAHEKQKMQVLRLPLGRAREGGGKSNGNSAQIGVRVCAGGAGGAAAPTLALPGARTGARPLAFPPFRGSFRVSFHAY
jgi:hypothetical protein